MQLTAQQQEVLKPTVDQLEEPLLNDLVVVLPVLVAQHVVEDSYGTCHASRLLAQQIGTGTTSESWDEKKEEQEISPREG